MVKKAKVVKEAKEIAAPFNPDVITPSTYAIDALEIIAAESNRDNKVTLLVRSCNVIPGFKRGCELALDVRYKFWIKKIPAYKPCAILSNGLPQAIEQLMPLVRRELAGDEALEYLSKWLEIFEEKDSKFLERVIMKDLDCGIGKVLFNKAFPNFILDIPHSLCHEYNESTADKMPFPVIGQHILPGDRILLELNLGKEPIMHLQTGETFPIPKNLNDDIGAISSKLSTRNPGMVLDGIFNGIHYTVYDIVTTISFYAGTDSSKYVVRLGLLEKLLPELQSHNHDIKCVKSTVLRSAADVETFLQSSEKGVILKNPQSEWKTGRSYAQMKLKKA